MTIEGFSVGIDVDQGVQVMVGVSLGQGVLVDLVSGVQVEGSSDREVEPIPFKVGKVDGVSLLMELVVQADANRNKTNTEIDPDNRDIIVYPINYRGEKCEKV